MSDSSQGDSRRGNVAAKRKAVRGHNQKAPLVKTGGMSLLERFPWVSSRTIVLSQRGKYDVVLPDECPLRLGFSEFTRAHYAGLSYHVPLEMSFIVEGRCRYTVEGTTYAAAAGDWIVVGTRELHCLEATSAGRVRSMGFYFLPELVIPPGSSPLDSELLRPFYYRGPGFSHRIPRSRVKGFPIADLMAKLYDELQSKGPHYVLAARVYVQNVLLEVVRQLSEYCTTPKSDKNLLEFERLEPVFNYIDQHLAGDITPHQISRIAHLSRSQFHRLFKKVTHLTFTEYLQKKRIDRARDLLLHSDLPVTQVGLRVGFGSHAYFDCVFNRVVGVSPSVYRGQRP